VNSLCPGQGGGMPLEWTWPSNYIKLTKYNTEYIIKSTEYRIENTTAAKLM
jgi:hypothetical protein